MTFCNGRLKRHDFVMSSDVIKHILPYNSAMEHLINYCILKTLNFLVLRICTQFIPHVSQSTQTLDYITLHYITLH